MTFEEAAKHQAAFDAVMKGAPTRAQCEEVMLVSGPLVNDIQEANARAAAFVEHVDKLSELLPEAATLLRFGEKTAVVETVEAAKP